MRVGFLVTSGHEPGFLRGTAGVIERLDGTRFEPVIFCAERGARRFRKSLKRQNLPIVPLPTRFDNAVKLVRQTGCDVIYYWKVGADPWNLFFPMAKLAPIQCTSWGTHGTSGVGDIDFYVSSSFIESTAAEVDVASHYTERLAMIPTLPTFQRRQSLGKPATRADFCLPPRGAIYFCPHRLPKYHPEFDSYLRDVLEQDPTGSLVMLCGKHTHAQEILRRRLSRSLGPTLCKRLFYLPAMPLNRYYQLLNLATMILDSPVYAGGITAYDAFSFGIPVVTQPGALAVQNYTAGLYRRMGISGLTARDQRQYVDIAVRLGTLADERREVTRRIVEASDSIFEDDQVTPALENFFLDAARAMRYIQ